MITASTVQALADALAHEAREHGVPNRFSPGEIYSRHTVPVPREQGQIAKHYSITLNDRLSQHGFRTTYAKRMFHVEPWLAEVRDV